MNILVDAMGGDHAPEEIVKGISQYTKEFDQKLIVLGDQSKVEPLLEKYEANSKNIELIHTSQTITMEDKPVMAIRQKKDSSLVRAFYMIKESKEDSTVITAGHSGAILAGGSLIIGRLPGIERPGFCPTVPTKTGSAVLMDSGANVDSRPFNLVSYALLAEKYANLTLGIEKPKIALLNIGTEKGKGNQLVKETYDLLAAREDINFIGFIEARETLSGDADVLVCDGFAGNMVLKSMEGTAKTILDMIKTASYKNLRSKLGALLLKPALKEALSKLDHREVGGAPVLGIKGGIIKSHGSADARAMYNAIKLGVRYTESGILSEFKKMDFKE